jgi:hypothetical protein
MSDSRSYMIPEDVVTAAHYGAWVNSIIAEFGGEPLDVDRFFVEDGAVCYPFDPAQPITQGMRLSYEILDLTKVHPGCPPNSSSRPATAPKS